MIKIGINENVYLANAVKNDKGTLELTFKQSGDVDTTDAELAEKLKDNPFADWEEGDVTYNENTGGMTIRIFPFDGEPTMKEPDKTPDATEMRNRIGHVRDPLTHILLGYMTKDKMPLKPSVLFAGTGIDTDINSFAEKIMSEAVQEKVYENIVDAFIAAITPYLDNPELLFRVKFPRQSPKKAFATLPTRFISAQNPFYEPMEIPAAKSKVSFSKWEIANGYDKDTPVAQTTSDAVEEEPEDDPFANR